MNDVVLSATGVHYDAVNRATGAVTHIYAGAGSGGLAFSPVVDAAHDKFYVMGDYGPSSTRTLTAYGYGGGGGPITQLWQKTGVGLGSGDNVALGPNGTLYAADKTTLIEIDPANGATLRSIGGGFSNGSTPMVTDGFVWEFGPGKPGTTSLDAYAYRLSDLGAAGHLVGTNGFSGTTYNLSSALDDTHFALDQGAGFIVFAGSQTPEPGASALLLAAAGIVLARRGRRAAGVVAR